MPIPEELPALLNFEWVDLWLSATVWQSPIRSVSGACRTDDEKCATRLWAQNAAPTAIS